MSRGARAGTSAAALPPRRFSSAASAHRSLQRRNGGRARRTERLASPASACEGAAR